MTAKEKAQEIVSAIKGAYLANYKVFRNYDGRRYLVVQYKGTRYTGQIPESFFGEKIHLIEEESL